MTPQELKFSVLKLAFSGKLVPQLDTETLIDKTSFQTNDALFDIPEKWRWNYIGKVCEMYTGNSISEHVKKNKYEGLEEGFDYIGTKDITFDNKIRYNNGVRIPFENNFKKAYPDSILMCIEGGSAGRKMAILDREVCFGNKLCMFKSLTAFNKYIYYFLQSSEFKAIFSTNLSGIIGGVSINKIKKFLIPIPPLEEQKRIVKKIEELLPLVDRYEDAWNKLEKFNKKFPNDMEKSILNYALQGKLVKRSKLSGVDFYNKIVSHKKELKIANKKHLNSNSECFPFDIPDNWKWCRLGDIVDYRMGKTPPRAETEWWKDDVPWISIGDMVENGYISCTKEKVSNSALHIKFGGKISPKGTLIMSFKLTVGRVSILNFDAVHNEAIISIFPYVDELNIFRNYLFYVLPFLSQFGDTKGAIKGNTLNNTSLCNLPIPLPSLEEQKRIVDKIEELLLLCKKLSNL